MGGYDDWVRQRRPDSPANRAKPPPISEKQRPKRETRQTIIQRTARTAGFPEVIEPLEAEQNELYRSMSEPTFYQKSGPDRAAAKARLKEIEQELDETYQRWDALDIKAREAATVR